jgi:hypothetical protein
LEKIQEEEAVIVAQDSVEVDLEAVLEMVVVEDMVKAGPVTHAINVSSQGIGQAIAQIKKVEALIIKEVEAEVTINLCLLASIVVRLATIRVHAHKPLSQVVAAWAACLLMAQ